MRSYFWCYYHPVCINWWKIYEVTERRWERGFPVADWLSFCIFVPTKNPHFVSSFRQRILVLYLRSDEEFSFYFSYFLGLCFHRHRKFSWASYPKMTEIWASGLWIVLSVTIIKSSIMTAQQKKWSMPPVSFRSWRPRNILSRLPASFRRWRPKQLCHCRGGPKNWSNWSRPKNLLTRPPIPFRSRRPTKLVKASSSLYKSEAGGPKIF